VDPDDVVLGPSPGYPPYARGTTVAGGRFLAYPVTEAGPVLPDLDRLPDEISERLAVVWITQPHVPTGRMATAAELERLADQVRARGALLCSDEAYSELWMDHAPPTALAAGSQDVLVFQSLSKRAAMTGYRVGFVTGDARAVAAFRKVKTNIDSGTPRFVEDAAIAALADEAAPAAARRRYAERAEVLVAALRGIGCVVDMPSAGFYLWARTPGGVSGVAFAQRLLAESPALAVMPGEWLTDPVAAAFGGAEVSSPGAGRVRFALVPSLAVCRQAAARLSEWSA
jgi:LL-diaminopimelate aminotransferase